MFFEGATRIDANLKCLYIFFFYPVPFLAHRRLFLPDFVFSRFSELPLLLRLACLKSQVVSHVTNKWILQQENRFCQKETVLRDQRATEQD